MRDPCRESKCSPSRRGFLASTLALVGSGTARQMFEAQGQETPGADRDEAEIALVRRQAEQAGLKAVRSHASATYLVVGDAPDAFLKAASTLCEGLARDYLTHFRQKGFAVERPDGRLTVVALSGPAAYAAYLGTTEDDAVGGQYDLQTNQLVMFDNRTRAGGGPMVERANTVVLMHEAMHQLTFNTGLLERGTDIPLCVNEGLGTYAETRRPDGRVPIGRLNEFRLVVLVDALRNRLPMTLVAELIAATDLPADPDGQQRFYAQSWLLVYHLLQTRGRAQQLRTYLEGVRDRRGTPANRKGDAETAFGDLARLDRELLATLTRVLRR